MNRSTLQTSAFPRAVMLASSSDAASSVRQPRPRAAPRPRRPQAMAVKTTQAWSGMWPRMQPIAARMRSRWSRRVVPAEPIYGQLSIWQERLLTGGFILAGLLLFQALMR